MAVLPTISNHQWPFRVEWSFDALTGSADHGTPDAADISRLIERFFPPELGESDIRAVCIPFSDALFNHTPRFVRLLQEAGPAFHFTIKDPDPHHSYIACCCLILNKYYGTHIDLQKPLLYEIPDADGISKYYRVLYNTRFIEVAPTEKAMAIHSEDIERLINSYDDLDLWKFFFPEESWLLKGFAFLTLIDVTVENAVSVFKEKLLALHTDNFRDSVTSIFRSVFGLAGIEVGFTLFDPMTRRLRQAIFNGQQLSFLLPDAKELPGRRVLGPEEYQQLIHGRKKWVVADAQQVAESAIGRSAARLFSRQGWQSFILAPVVKDGQVAGLLEVVAPGRGDLHSIGAQKLDVVMPFLADAILRLITRFQLQADAIIQQRYTAIHPSVKWRFVQEVEKWLYSQELGKPVPMAEIVLEDVTPFYGQVDLRGSSRQRNECVQLDLLQQMDALLRLLHDTGLLPEQRKVIEKSRQQIESVYAAYTEESIAGYLAIIQRELVTMVKGGRKDSAITTWLTDCDPQKGAFHRRRRDYLHTVASVNNNLVAVLNEAQIAAQQIVPHYCEFYKTDGLEHVLYAGRAITPHLPFSHDTIEALRYWQLETICKMERSHHTLMPQLPYPLDVTCLVLAWQHPLTLRFRTDEKHFDVDGSYNVKFEVLKKRIDKATVKQTGERITMPGRLTIVYAGAQDEQAYGQLLNRLYRAGWTEKGWETLELEDLPDVTGLKALRAVFVY
jgi:hypothetical protein